MAYQALYRAWRPNRFGDVVGQEPIVTTLVHQIETGHIAHAYLFCGSRGTGKTTTAKVLARAINCAHPLEGAEPCGQCPSCLALAQENSMDVMEIDAASNNGVDEVRALRDQIAYPPTVGRYKVYIIDEVHMLSTGAFNALLKTLEEPPAHAVFILATTEPQKLPATILSRCQRFDFKRISVPVIVGRLREVLQGVKRQAEEEALQIIARAAEGGMRDALSLMDMCLSYGDGPLTAALVRQVLGTSDRAFLFDFAQALLEGRAGKALTLIHQMSRDGGDPAVFLKEVVAHFRGLMLSQLVEEPALADLLEITLEDAGRYRAQAQGVDQAALMGRMSLFMAAEADLKWVSQPRTAVELAAVRACNPQGEKSLDALLERLDKLERALAQGALSPSPGGETAAPARPVKAKPKAKPAPSEAPAPQQGEQKAAEGKEVWERAAALVTEAHPEVSALVGAAVFAGIREGQALLEFPKRWQMYYAVLQNAGTGKRQLIEEALSQAAGRPISLRLALQENRSASRSAAKENLTQIYEAFGRENVVVVDD